MPGPVQLSKHLSENLNDPAGVVGPRDDGRQPALARRRHRVSLRRRERVQNELLHLKMSIMKGHLIFES